MRMVQSAIDKPDALQVPAADHSLAAHLYRPAKESRLSQRESRNRPIPRLSRGVGKPKTGGLFSIVGKSPVDSLTPTLGRAEFLESIGLLP
jgi:hypothetical protein